jgi:hypothetical protein
MVARTDVLGVREVKQKGFSKKGDRYRRPLLACGAMAMVRQAQIRPDKIPRVTKLSAACLTKHACDRDRHNKTARIAWAIMVHGGVYEAGHRAPQYRAEGALPLGAQQAPRRRTHSQ